MGRSNLSRRSFREVLEDKRGSSIAESMAGVVLIMVALSVLAVNVTGGMNALTGVATKAERQAYITALVGEKHALATWGTPDDPNTQTVTLPNGREIEITTWREDTPVSTRLTAVAPTSSGEGSADCTTPADVAKVGCVYASRLHANGLDEIAPEVIIHKDPTIDGDEAVGAVHADVGTDRPISQGMQFAAHQGADDPTVWRYLIKARALEPGAELWLHGQGETLAKIPLDTESNNYFGTYVLPAGGSVSFVVTSGSVLIDTVYVYRAGSGS